MAIRIKSPRQNYLSSITGPQLATISGSTITYHEKYPLLVLSGGFVAETNTDQRYTTLSIDTSLIDLSAWSHHAAGTDINAGGNKVINVSNPTNPNDAVNLQTLENTIDTELSGWASYTASTNPNIGGNRITNVADPTDPNDAVNLQTLQNEVSNWSSHAATSTPNMGGNRVTNVAEPVTNTDAATRGYVNSLFTGTVAEEYYQVVVLGGSTASGSSALEFQVSASSQPLGNPLDYKTGLSTTHVISASLTDQNKILWAVGSGGYVVSRSLGKFSEWGEFHSGTISRAYSIDYKCMDINNNYTYMFAGGRNPSNDHAIVARFDSEGSSINLYDVITSNPREGVVYGIAHIITDITASSRMVAVGQRDSDGNGFISTSANHSGSSWSTEVLNTAGNAFRAVTFDRYTNKFWVVGDGGYVYSSSNSSGTSWEEVTTVSTNYPIDYNCITTDDKGTIVLAGKRTAGLEQNSIVQLFFPTATTMNAPLSQTAHNNFTGSFHAVSYVPENDEFVLVGQDGVMQRSGSNTSNVWTTILSPLSRGSLYTIAQRNFSSYGGSNWAQYPAVKNVDVNGFSIENVSGISTADNFAVTASNIEFVNYNTSDNIPVFDNTYTGLPSGVNSIMNGLALLGNNQIEVGTYTPTCSGSLRAKIIVPGDRTQYIRIGSIVFVTGRLDVSGSGTGAYSVDISLPVASYFNNVYKANGLVTVTGQNDGVGYVSAVLSSNVLRLSYTKNTNYNAHPVTYMAAYEIA